VNSTCEKTRILLVEDNPDHAELLRTILAEGESRPFAVSEAGRVDEALEYLVREEVDVVLLDLGLPDCSGFEGLERVHETVPGTPIVVLTAMGDEAAAVRALRKGAQDYLLKGLVDYPQLARAIRYAMERHRGLRQLELATNELRSAKARLEELALLDPLTGILNRRGLQQALSREIRWAARNHSEVQALLLDLDDFKWINDTLGHAVGDVVLKELAHKLKATLRATDYLARIGGDEFLVLLPQTGSVQAREIAEKVRLTVSATPLSLSSGVVKITASLGVARVSEKTSSVDQLLSEMHFVLYRSKQAGKNRISCDRWGKHVCATADGSPSGVLQTLLRDDALRVVRQPIVRLADERVTGYEFLSRLSHEVFEGPNDFFRLCLEANILTSTDFRCFKNCIAAAASLPPHIRRHLNLFPSTMIGIPVGDLLEAFPSDRLDGTYCVEISEQQIIGDPLNLAEPVNALQQSGILIAFDDVGYGHSCLESLTLLEPDIIKIDKRCITGISTDPSRMRSLKRLLKVAASLSAEVVAEGIESREDLDLLQCLGVQYGQGFLWAKPA
jgi:diguanylate cyclase (GGDEF)-like protein